MPLHESDLGRDDYTATYCPEDDKLRIYCGRVARESYETLRRLGFQATPKQDCAFVATWAPYREALALSMIAPDDDIGDEDTPPAERAADRAARFEGYRERRRADAHGLADRYEAGPSAFGNQDGRRAARAASRRDRTGERACSQWAKAEYWQHRTAGVISHALHRSSASVRRGRILRLEAEQRKHEASVETARAVYDGWQAVAAEPDAAKSYTLAYALANGLHSGGYDFQHPRNAEARPTSLYSLLTRPEGDAITGPEAAALYLERFPLRAGDEGSSSARWSNHYRLRLDYERAMLEAEGGSAADDEMAVGGWLGSMRIHKVNRSPVTGRVVSVGLWGPHRWRKNPDGSPAMGAQTVNVERLAAGIYRPATPEELAAFKVEQKTKKAAQKAKAPKVPPILNPTDADAQRLQDALNERARSRLSGDRWALEAFKPSDVIRMTQAEYSRHSAGTYSSCDMFNVHAGPVLDRRSSNMWNSATTGRPLLFRVRGSCRGCSMASAYRVVVLTDKPQRPLPDWTHTPATAEQTAQAVTA